MGAYGIQLSEETAIGKYPMECLDVVARIVEIWPTPEEASAWTTRVLGDMVVRTTGEPDASQAGLGLLPDYDEISQELVEALRALVAGETPPSG